MTSPRGGPGGLAETAPGARTVGPAVRSTGQRLGDGAGQGPSGSSVDPLRSVDPRRPERKASADAATPRPSSAGPASGGPAAVTEPRSEGSALRPVRGADLARAALDSARSAARAKEPERARWRRVAGQRRSGWSGARADPRDPQPFGAAIERLMSDRGWQRQSAEATVLARWGHLVGAGIAEHSQPVSLRDGALVVAAESTAWATQLRLLAPRILQRLRGELGADIVTSLRVHGPTAPSWKKGPRTVRGRGPRDTYG